MVLAKLRVWRDKWRARRFWKLRLAMIPVSLGVIAWLWFGDADLSNRTDFYVFMAVVWVPIVTDLAFWRSDARAERDRSARSTTASSTT